MEINTVVNRPTKPIINCSSIILVNDKGQLLCHQRNNGLWEVPGGKADPGENIYQTAVRELYEETGIEVVEFGDIIGSTLVEDKDNDWFCTYIFVKSFKGIPIYKEPGKGSDWSWTSCLSDKAWIMSVRQMIIVLVRFLNEVLVQKLQTTKLLCNQPSCKNAAQIFCCDEYTCRDCHANYHSGVKCNNCGRDTCLSALLEIGETCLCTVCKLYNKL
jgi:8-oxo-dGTP pyrophosphatase MutT (NUDIX family)